MSSVGILYYTQPQVYKAQKALVAAKFNGVTIDAKIFDSAKDSAKPDFLIKNPTGKVPFLQTDMGCLFTSGSIARYIARIRSDTSLFGRSFLEEGLIDSWLDFCTHEIEVPLMTWVYPCMGLMADVPQATAQAKEDVKKALKELEAALSPGPYLLGAEVTLADIAVVCSLKEGFCRVFDPAYRKPFPKVSAWFEKCCALPQFKSVLGDVALCAKAEAAKAFTPPPAAKAAAAPKDNKKADKASPKAAPKADPKKGAAPKAAAAPAGGSDAAITALGDEIRVLKEKLKAEGLSGKKINDHPEIKAKVEQLQALKAGGAAAPAASSSPKASPKAKPAAAPAAGGGNDAAITALGDEIRQLKEKLKAEGLSGKKINDHPEVKAAVEKLQALKAGAAAAPAAAPAAASGGGGSVQEQVDALGLEIRALKEKLKGEGLSGKKVNDHADVKAMVAKLTELKGQL